ncbi:hypothetical protein ACA910_009757 [Epithemia clementina (nom. ined.)]
MSDNNTATFRRLDAGARTVEGNVSGSRAAALEKKRLQDIEEFENQKRQRLERLSSNVHSLASSFRPATKASALEQSFSLQTVGLVTAQEYQKAAAEALNKSNMTTTNYPLSSSSQQQQEDEEAAAQQREQETEEARKKREKAERKAKKLKLKEKKKMLSTLSFAGEEEEQVLNKDDGDDNNTNSNHENNNKKNKKKSKKDPTVDTSFLPDPLREEQLQLERQRLEQEWLEQQAAIKQESLEITYSYWDGSGHRKSIICRKGDSIGQFLQAALDQQLRNEFFRQLQHKSAEDFLYVKEDLILPHDVTFYDLIATKARGKSGPLFYFHVGDDVRVGPVDTRVEKEDSHPGKVVERQWYERNKHIFPASRWQVYDPTLETYGTYKIGGK